MTDDAAHRRSLRMTQHPWLRAVFLAMVMVVAALGIPVRVEPPPKGRAPVEVVRDEDEGRPETR